MENRNSASTVDKKQTDTEILVNNLIDMRQDIENHLNRLKAINERYFGPVPENTQETTDSAAPSCTKDSIAFVLSDIHSTICAIDEQIDKIDSVL